MPRTPRAPPVANIASTRRSTSRKGSNPSTTEIHLLQTASAAEDRRRSVAPVPRTPGVAPTPARCDTKFSSTQPRRVPRPEICGTHHTRPEAAHHRAVYPAALDLAPHPGVLITARTFVDQGSPRLALHVAARAI